MFEDRHRRALATAPVGSVAARVGLVFAPFGGGGQRPLVWEVEGLVHRPARRTRGSVPSASASPVPASACSAGPVDEGLEGLSGSAAAMAWVESSASCDVDELVEQGSGLGLALGLVGRLEAAGSLSALGGDDLLSVLAGFDKVGAWAAAMQRRAIGLLALGRERPVRDETDAAGEDAAGEDAAAGARVGASGSQRWVEAVDYTADEVGLVLGCSVRAAQALVLESTALVRELPETLNALQTGRVRLPAARVIVEHTAGLDTWVRRAVQDRVLGPAENRTPAQTRRAVRRAVLSIDPAGARAREVRARRGRCVSTGGGDDGMASLSLYAPVADVASAYENIDRFAHRLARAPGEQRGQQALRADLAAAALCGRIFLGDADVLAAAVSSAGLEAVLPEALSPSRSGISSGDSGDRAAAAGRRRRAVRAEIVVTGADSTLAGLDDQPGELAGYGPVSAATLRELAGQAGTVHALRTDPDTGEVTDVISITPPPAPDDDGGEDDGGESSHDDGGGRRGGRDGEDGGSSRGGKDDGGEESGGEESGGEEGGRDGGSSRGCEDGCDHEHGDGPPRGGHDGPRDGGVEAARLAQWLRALVMAANKAVRHERAESRHGTKWSKRGKPGDRGTDEDTVDDEVESDGGRADGWTAGGETRERANDSGRADGWIAGGETRERANHATASDARTVDAAADAYTPPPALRRFIVARDRRCRFPRCERWAERCDLDHTIPHPVGRTNEANLGALCRRHHRLKQTLGWRLRQPRAGYFVWTTPTGRRFTVRPPNPLDPD